MARLPPVLRGAIVKVDRSRSGLSALGFFDTAPLLRVQEEATKVFVFASALPAAELKVIWSAPAVAKKRKSRRSKVNIVYQPHGIRKAAAAPPTAAKGAVTMDSPGFCGTPEGH